MEWILINNQSDLDLLKNSYYWGDTETIEFFASKFNCSYFPDDISRSGYEKKNLHLLLEVSDTKRSHLEIVFIDCDNYNSDYIENISFSGKVDTLKRVEIIDYQDELVMRCSRLIYRELAIPDTIDKSYFINSLDTKSY